MLPDVLVFRFLGAPGLNRGDEIQDAVEQQADAEKDDDRLGRTKRIGNQNNAERERQESGKQKRETVNKIGERE